MPQNRKSGADATIAALRANLSTLSQQVREDARGDANSGAILQPLIDNLSVAAFVADPYGRYVLVNRLACELTGYEPRELTRLSVWDLTPHVNEHDAERLWHAFLDRREQSGEYRLRVKGGVIVEMLYAAQVNILPGLHVSLLAELPGARRGSHTHTRQLSRI